MKLTLPPPPAPEEVAAAQLAATNATQEATAALAAYNAAATKSRLANEARAAVARRQDYADRCVALAAEHAGSLVQREDGQEFGALIGKGAQRRTLRKIPTYGSAVYSDSTVHAVKPGVWSDYPNGRGFIWHEVTE